jgi:SNF2 family DNA or RNA helicase
MRPQSDLRHYQERIASFLYEHDSAICTARPGFGKTIAALTAIAELKRDGVIRHALVIAPKRVARQVWPDEIAAWAHVAGLRHAVLTGSPTERTAMLAAADERDITIVGLDILGWLIEELLKLPVDHPLFDLLVIDEISKLRNPTGVRSKLAAKHADRWKLVWGLSGTLRPNSALDLFMPARIVTCGRLWGRSFYRWQKNNFYPTDRNGYNWAPFPGAEERLNAELAPLVTTLGADDMLELPKLTVIFDRVELPDDARRQYDRMQTRLITKARDATGVVAGSTAIASGKLAQIANGFVYDESTVPHRMHDAKREWLTDLIEDASAPMLLVYEFIEDLELMGGLLGGKLPYLGAGVTNAQSDRNIEDWNAGKLPFMALHPASGGHGLNLQHGGADMAWLAPTWSPEMWEQTIARLHRSGQTRPVVIRVCVAERTVDELKLNRVYFKMSAQEAFEHFLRNRLISE